MDHDALFFSFGDLVRIGQHFMATFDDQTVDFPGRAESPGGACHI